MPTATSLSQAVFRNVGALTTTFTAPSSCATQSAVALAPTDLPTIPVWIDGCAIRSVGDCFPNGKQRDSIYAPDVATFGGWDFLYYSPGIACPASWTTAGVATKFDNGSVALTGIYAPSAVITLAQTTPTENPWPNIFVEGLGTGETAVACCPSKYTADLNGLCNSNLPVSAYTATTACQRQILTNVYTLTPATYSWNGGTYTATVVTITATRTDAFSSIITTFKPSAFTSFTGLSQIPIVTLVHKAEDLTKTTGGTTSASTSNVANGLRAEMHYGNAGAVFTVWMIIAVVFGFVPFLLRDGV